MYHRGHHNGLIVPLPHRQLPLLHHRHRQSEAGLLMRVRGNRGGRRGHYRPVYLEPFGIGHGIGGDLCVIYYCSIIVVLELNSLSASLKLRNSASTIAAINVGLWSSDILMTAIGRRIWPGQWASEACFVFLIWVDKRRYLALFSIDQWPSGR